MVTEKEKTRMRSILTFVIFFTGTLFGSTVAQAQNYSGYGHRWGDWGWGHMVFGSLTMVLIWGSVIVVVVLLVRWLTKGASNATTTQTENTAMDILKARFARGEIDKEEFEERKRVLSD